jgi:NTE family protein
LRRPVRIGAHRFVDGGIASPTHLDLLSDLNGEPPRLVVVSSPLSQFAPMRLLLRLELRRLRHLGTRVVVFEPTREVAATMGWNPMDARLASPVAVASYRAACERLSAGGAALFAEVLEGRS